MKVTLKILLLGAVVLLSYMCYRSIMGPIEFQDEKTLREDRIIKRLMDIRAAQIEYKNRKGVHAANFDELTTFLNTEKLPYLLKEGVLTDEQLESGMTEADAVKKGLIKRDTFWVLAKDTLFGGKNVDSLRFVPGTVATFQMDTASITNASGYTLQLFEASVEYPVYLGDLNKQEVANLIDLRVKQDKYPGLKVGSVKEANNYAGNWE